MNRTRTPGGLVALLAVLASAAGIVAYTVRIAPRWLEVVRLRVAIPSLPPEWSGLKIAHLSDFHAGGGVPLDLLQRAKAVAIAASPDVIALTGDFYSSGTPSDVDDLFSTWPENVPVLAVLGNHDHRASDADRERLLDELMSSGVEVLLNRAVMIELRGIATWAVGVDDPFSWLMDEAAAFGALPASAEALLYLAHSPVAARTIQVGRVRLMLTGHTHGGQVRLIPDGRVPFATLARRMRGSPARPDPDFHRGVHWLRGTVVVVSHGLGVSKLPWRFRTRPQVVLIELANADDDGPACDSVDRYVTRLNPEPVWLRWLS